MTGAFLKGISTGEMSAALKALLGPDATGFSAKTISRLKGQWAAEYNDWHKADLRRDDWVYIWADGIYSGLRDMKSAWTPDLTIAREGTHTFHYLWTCKLEPL